MKLFDSHAHYNDEKFDLDREELLEKLYQGEVKRIINAGYDVISSRLAVKMAEIYPEMYAICGISPNNLPEMKYAIQIDSETQLKKKLMKFEKLHRIKKSWESEKLV